ncbi:ClpXP protease specificity-enhancing factor [Massilia sp. CCM 8733]|uniref:ClpXP protease specificity-enhancing factor n=1 Tax=Massilia mucilaginosa TaxID=2609282 RepID=A0ABX0NZV5_9BURK|nr:ClpXP protease specificity-enhancing factor [Massilia mucilaginosa]NHZ92485.1 ClpXP protease specificity-enhancing factor [Massilia mucilaginosa]
MPEISTKPYLLRAIYEWCTDNGFTPYLAVKVDAATTVPMEFVKKGEIVLNISFGATSGLKMDNDAIQFHARFGGVSREIYVPVQNVLAIYGNENGQGMAFEVSSTASENAASQPTDSPLSSVPALAKVPPVGLQSVPVTGADSAPTGVPATAPAPDDNNDPPKKGGRPTLTRIK